MTNDTKTSAADELRSEGLRTSIALWLGTMTLFELQRVDMRVLEVLRDRESTSRSTVEQGLRELRYALVVPTRPAPLWEADMFDVGGES